MDLRHAHVRIDQDHLGALSRQSSRHVDGDGSLPLLGYGATHRKGVQIELTGRGPHQRCRRVEPLGDRKDVYLTGPAGQKFIANIDPHVNVSPDDAVTVYLDLEQVHVFEPADTGKNVSLN